MSKTEVSLVGHDELVRLRRLEGAVKAFLDSVDDESWWSRVGNVKFAGIEGEDKHTTCRKQDAALIQALRDEMGGG